MRVIPTFCAMTPERMCLSFKSPEPFGLELNLYVDAGGEVELHQRVHRLGRRIDDIEHTLVRAHLELLARLLIDVRRAQHREALEARRQRDGPAHLGAGPLRRRHDFTRRSVENSMIERLEADADVLTVHRMSISRAERGGLAAPR